MTERNASCPRCNVPLAGNDLTERWRCRQCRGAAISTRELVAALRKIAPDLVPSDQVWLLETQRPGKPLACPCCGGAMTAIALDPEVVVDRCPNERMLWFDDWEQGVAVFAASRNPGQRPWLEQMLRAIIPDPDPAAPEIILGRHDTMPQLIPPIPDDDDEPAR